MKRNVRLGLVGLLITCAVVIHDILLIAVAAAAMSAFSLSPSSSSPVATDQPVFVTTAASSFTAEPLLTPTETLVPTTTSTPTITPTPTIAPTATPDTRQLESQYTSEVLSKLVNIRADLQIVADQSDIASRNSLIIKTKAWQDKFFSALEDMQRSTQELSQLQAPNKFAKVQAWLNKLYPETRDMNADFRKGVDNFDVYYIREASDHLSNIATYLQNATNEMNALTE